MANSPNQQCNTDGCHKDQSSSVPFILFKDDLSSTNSSVQSLIDNNYPGSAFSIRKSQFQTPTCATKWLILSKKRIWVCLPKKRNDYLSDHHYDHFSDQPCILIGNPTYHDLVKCQILRGTNSRSFFLHQAISQYYYYCFYNFVPKCEFIGEKSKIIFRYFEIDTSDKSERK